MTVTPADPEMYAQCPAHAMLALAFGRPSPLSGTNPRSASPQLYPCWARPESWSAFGTSPWIDPSGRSFSPHRWCWLVTTVDNGLVSHADARHAIVPPASRAT